MPFLVENAALEFWDIYFLNIYPVIYRASILRGTGLLPSRVLNALHPEKRVPV